MALADEMAVTAQRRFGFGPVPDGWRKAGSDARETVLLQLDGYKYSDTSGLLPSTDILRELRERQREVRDARAAVVNAAAPVNGAPGNGASGNGAVGAAAAGAAKAPDGAVMMVKTPDAAAAVTAENKEIFKQKNEFVRIQFENEAAYRQQAAVTSDRPLIERLTDFWAGHFCISCSKGEDVRVIAGAYEREAIRPYVTGRFRDMLGAIMHHPAMLYYLDNHVSFGPTSKAGQKQKKGLNENLGRELMELHTVGVKAGYNQTDVTNAARIITGWGIAGDKDPSPGAFKFDPNRHEPGAFTVMGTPFAEGGEAQGEALLDMLAAHPATAQHIAEKLVRHFVGDKASPALVETVAKRFRATNGDLRETMLTLVKAPEAWSLAPAKVISPYDMAICCERILALNTDPKKVVNFARVLGQPLWTPRSPNGFPDNDMAWAAPNALVKRFDYALQLAGQPKTPPEPMELASALFGPALKSDMQTAIKRAASRREALAMIVMSPEIQVR
ncbi:DUF1800 domain-containing protein [Rhizobium sp. C4]|uniref:DUF1800 domain-containing protein n=1 Tax=Rhizobium sp. C4 TaxID=1349800 RepID=UPI001E39D2ED|nr:DUF1800 domain-containing protein [Rhizobium sp. C4]MCD2175309.1 DUF1800 domain-containing protein [Rhizobium sp. C4]